ncbi:MAG: endolytic transglycosylase MltG [Candidatus Kerfeldbacteria bacterium]|nr:endolytic transglycosylase MltG [Candidatus Kerfeldbacteria bacterium]
MFSFLKPKISFRLWFRTGLVIISAVVLLSVFLIWQLVVPVGRGDQVKSFVISSGQSVKEIELNLRAANFIRSGFWFEIWVWFTGTEKRFVAGEYRLSAGTNLINLVRWLTGAAPPSSEITVTLVEGWTRQQMADYLSRVGFNDAVNFLTLTGSIGSMSGALQEIDAKLFASKPAAASLEGYLFPDTYRLYHDAESLDLVTKMLINFKRKFSPLWLEAGSRQGHSVHAIVTLASIVEREVSSAQDRALVADIFWRRLKVGRGLEADSTINYITGKKTPAVSVDDLKLNSPYNTYRYRGLPPGPISNPGESALRAVMQPTPNQYWYFLTTKDGQVIYSKTFEEHKAVKQKYLR